ncbi:hypothetical protein NEUTE1DRAFT_120798 [Neurospora tetrasperma FGSC 2508]|uniref:Uncharacterized protein n=1 Tax=Neurospora tetrasperma (strain FGSC 2508 / ATCC MYA-4615 / P0657) TaxID=510951 RepID=F8MHX0_NEUT8|nr:uncharacterized protein NEUTE1DRAFT_120798 [Neurospora tetrasperma FGSC 2508]EGO58879.1 hypothetical protein NEUTE1DRAFT_120798 [Neurospora tetrasperma FGSC 2508]EGZ72979.1 hypothetical protein NEUTE2DRAFT_156545 [Neurospora tetrasperma FGSC 2509]
MAASANSLSFILQYPTTASSSFMNPQYPTMTTSTRRAIETLPTVARRDSPEVLLTDSRPPPSPTSFNPSVLTQESWTTKISGLPTAIVPPSSTSSSAVSSTHNTASLNHGTSISLIPLLSLSVAVIMWVLYYILISRRRRAGRSVPRLWPSFSLFAFSRRGRAHFTFQIKRSDSRTSLLPSDRLAAGAGLGYQVISRGNGRDVDKGQTAVVTWTYRDPPPVELDGQGIGDSPIRPNWVSRISSFLVTEREGKGHGCGQMDPSLRATGSIRESFGEKINDPGVAVLIREPKKTLSRYSRAISEKALPEIPESEEIVPLRLGSPRENWERMASRNTFRCDKHTTKTSPNSAVRVASSTEATIERGPLDDLLGAEGGKGGAIIDSLTVSGPISHSPPATLRNVIQLTASVEKLPSFVSPPNCAMT